MNKKEIAPSVWLSAQAANAFKTNRVSLTFLMPLDPMTASRAALLSFVLRAGCAQYPDVTAIGRVLQEMYGAEFDVSVRKKGDTQLVTFSLDFLDRSFTEQNEDTTAQAFSFLKEILFRPLLKDGSFSEALVEREKKNLCDLIDSRINDKRLYALQRCAELASEGQPASQYEMGSCALVREITPEDLTEFYRRWLSRAQVRIFAFGRVGEAETEAFFAPLFGERCPIALKNEPLPEREARVVTERFPVEQAKLSMAFGIEGEAEVVTLAHILLGGSANSLLFQNVREKESLCYYCSTWPEKLKKMLVIYAGIQPKNAQRTREAILEQVQALQKGEFSAEDLAAAKKTLIHALRAMGDSTWRMEDEAITQSLLGTDQTPDQRRERVETITAQEIMAVTQTMALRCEYQLMNEG